ncbi:NADH-quinone oxidoreductase subunit G [Arcobacter sp. FWKO B]|uniref:NADH-quinone oxidoreductase subunit G n=1 Tax=Arcobacter sp. FWKO B TaxID=2593672 RepID=UPI0018A61712|nr:NADH-quinone oxidoreductase subunit G [Arcobacter sp. FWKO B]QOG12199.1 NADH-quinone oxidoreductase subunit G [Arcobacter sp. FWKO B]
MSNLITLTIDGKEVKANEGEFILNVARANGIFIPAICYLTRCSPTLACRLCLVEADGKQVYSCNAKVKDGMNIATTTDNIEQERRAIMEVYDVNHPLQCGVCDQSGECELQNYTLYMGVDKQNYAIKDTSRPAQNWGVMKYDPGLCIVCEKCVTVCKDMIGSNALGTVKRGGEDLDKSYKESMPKDAYAMWNKLNKSLIGFEEDKCIDCGECISVCPVGALVSSDFQYKSNAWELTRIPASNPHSSDCSLMYYETKHDSIVNNKSQKIYRVTNDSHYVSLSGAARFGFEYALETSKDNDKFTQAVEAFKKADTIKFSSFITNEEALILQKLREKFGYRLINNDAKKYQNFIKSFSTTSGTTLYNGSLKDIHESNFVISVGSFFKSDAPSVRYAFNNSISMNKGAGLYFHPMEDITVENFGKKGKTIEVIKNKPLSEEAILYFILDLFGKELPEDVSSYINSQKEIRSKKTVETIKETIKEIVEDEETGEKKEVEKIVPKKVETVTEYQYSKLLDLIGADEALLETINAMLDKKDCFSLIIGEDLIHHPRSENLAKLVGLIQRCTDFKVVIIPTQTNTLGVSQICELDSECGSYVIGYNKSGDFTLSALGDGDLDMPPLLQQEGTFTNIDKRVVPTNAALPYSGYTLNDIANALGLMSEYSIDYTTQLPKAKGYKNIEFDSLSNYFSNDFKENRGYLLDISDISYNDKVDFIKEQTELDGDVIYKANPINQFNEFTSVSKQIKDKMGCYMSKSKAESLSLEDGNIVKVESNGNSIELEVVIDGQLSGDICYIPTFDKNKQTCKLFGEYRYTTAVIKK